ncbi:hypothetical protein SAMN05216339_1213 [Nitrosomonas eutropha]|uniref:Uncharacterized protein n=1 Tax=Nitrosomonas eutropha TaxID=916 RepID=A0A1I7JCK6_9PROT|nr:hypothetical protein SAMN05216339_1213 [Nitrosomonas eutropha]
MDGKRLLTEQALFKKGAKIAVSTENSMPFNKH